MFIQLCRLFTVHVYSAVQVDYGTCLYSAVQVDYGTCSFNCVGCLRYTVQVLVQFSVMRCGGLCSFNCAGCIIHQVETFTSEKQPYT